MLRKSPCSFRIFNDLRLERQMSPTEWQQLQMQRLRRLLLHAREQVPYYRQLFQRAGFDPASAQLPQDFQQLPLLTKTVVRRFEDQLVAHDAARRQITPNATGGSTGQPLTFFQDQCYRDVGFALDRFVREWWGITPYDRTAVIWGADREFRELSLRDRFYNWRHRVKSLNAFRLTEEAMRSFCDYLLHWRPRYLIGYATALDCLAKFVIDQDITLRFHAIRSSAETLFDTQRAAISKAFKSPVFDFYGSREINNLAAECPEQHSLHAISTWRFIEIVDEDGNPVSDGEKGHIAVTDLSNFGMPFIRYCNEDLAIKLPNRCVCGRPSPVLGKLLGRQSDLIVLPNGEKIHGEWFTHLFYGTKYVGKFQIHQPSVNKLVLRYVPLGNGCESEISQIAKAISDRFGSGVIVSTEPHTSLSTPPSGKHRFTISEVDFDR